MRERTEESSGHPTTDSPGRLPPPARARAALLALGVFLVFNANGRELGTYDSQPGKLLAREIVVRHVLTLDEAVRRAPQLGERSAFVRTSDGHYRSAMSVVPPLFASAIGWVLQVVGLVDMEAPLAPNLVAKVTASLLSSLAVALGFLLARYRVSDRAAAIIALGFGLGTNVWALASQTLWQHETVLFGLTGALLCLGRAPERWSAGRVAGAAALLALAGAARPQVGPAVAVLALSAVVRRPRADTFLALALLPLGAAAIVALNLLWFGHPLGGVPVLEALHPKLHALEGSLSHEPWRGAAGLLASPSRGLLIFSPIVLMAALGLRAARQEGHKGDLAWCAIAAVAQFGTYSMYAPWWGGHTYGPRYLLDVLPMLVPLAAAGWPVLVSSPAGRVAGVAALAWSIALAATGFVCYPAEQWNTSPMSVDLNHERLWDWSDPQFVRCWRERKASPQTFDLFLAEGYRTVPDAGSRSR